MYFWNSYPFVRLSIALILGVLCFDHFPIAWNYSIWALSIGFFLLFGSIFVSGKTGFYKLRHLNGFLSLSLIFFIGGFVTKLQYHEKAETHYTQLANFTKGFAGTITDQGIERKNHFRYELKLQQVATQDSVLHATGKIHLYVKKDSTFQKLSYGDQINVYGSYFSIHAPNNPYEFDYKSYLKRQKIYAQAFVETQDIEVIGQKPLSTIMAAGYQLRKSATNIIDKHLLQPRENGIAKALILGVKDDLDNEIKQAYSAAGAMHVLAVSGLHVGIIYLIIKMVFGKLKLFGNVGRFLFGVICVGAIWLYAMVTGFSPSVLRAATMFSLIVIGELNNRDGNVYNSLGIAAFVLLLIDPYLVYAVGFQLSFVAVIGIVYLQPKLYQMFEFRNMVIDKCWSITCVSIAAQIATFPLSAHYFHQFPTYFLISNLVVIPASFLILTSGIAMLLLDLLIPSISSFIGVLLQKLIWAMNESIFLLLELPGALIDWIRLDGIEVVLIYTIIITFLASHHFGTFKTLALSGCLLIGLMAYNLWEQVLQSKKHALVFYKLSNEVAVDYIKGHSAILFTNSLNADDRELLSYQIDPHRLHSFLKPISESSTTFEKAGFVQKDALIQGVIAGKRFVIVDSTTFHLKFKDRILTDYLILNNGSVKNLSWLSNHFDFETLIIGPKNSIYYSREMKRQANETGIKIHSLKEDKALIVPLE